MLHLKWVWCCGLRPPYLSFGLFSKANLSLFFSRYVELSEAAHSPSTSQVLDVVVQTIGSFFDSLSCDVSNPSIAVSSNLYCGAFEPS